MSWKANLDIRRRRALFRAWRRGTVEVDHLLGRFAEAYIATLGDRDLTDFETLMELPDPDIFNWVTGSEPPPDRHLTPVLSAIIAFHAPRQEPD
jgi:antitoxin CptB